MINTIEITKEYYDELMNSDDYYNACSRAAEKESINTIWPAEQYGVYAPRTFYIDNKYYLSWSHKAFKHQTCPYI